MCDKAATAVQKTAPMARVLLGLCLSFCAQSAFGQLSDPMAPPGIGADPAEPQSTARSGARSELQGIISAPGRRMALINGAVVQVGEAIPGNGELLSVDPDSATVRSGEKNIRLRLHPDLKKESAR